MEQSFKERSWSEGGRAAVSLSITAAVAVLALCLRQTPVFRGEYFWQNQLVREGSRERLVGFIILAAGAAFAAALAFLVARRNDPDASTRLRVLAARVAPLGPLAAFSCLFSWELYLGHDLTFLALALLVALALGATIATWLRTGPTALERRLWARLPWRTGGAPAEQVDRACLAVVAVAVIAYVVYFSYVTVVWHRCVRSGYDLAIEDNILWNLLHARGFYHAAPTLGPTGSHFGRHATLVSFLLLPFYALHQSAETLHVLESTFIGAAALPLFLFARRRIGSVPAALLALAYLLHPAVEEGNLFEMHYVKLGAVFFFSTLWLLDSGRYRLGLAAAAMTLLVREDVATWVLLLGIFSLLSDQMRVPRRVGLAITVVAGLYVAVVKFVAMPLALHGGDDLLFMYTGLLPQGRHSFAWVLATAVGNPALIVESLLKEGKLLFLLLTLVPLAMVPFRRGLGFLALIPGFVFCWLSPSYTPLIDIHYQYSPHVLAFAFPTTVFVLEAIAAGAGPAPGAPRDRAPLAAAMVAMVAATLACSYQYGAVFQRHTSRGGPLPFKFGWDDEGRERQRAIQRIKEIIPDTARVAASAFTVPQFSARHDGYSLAIALFDADWIVVPTKSSEYVSAELPITRAELGAGRFGVVEVAGPFFAAQRGASTERNAEMLARLAGP